jgi:hypothetical protein
MEWFRKRKLHRQRSGGSAGESQVSHRGEGQEAVGYGLPYPKKVLEL